MPKLILDAIYPNQYITNAASAYISHQSFVNGDPSKHSDYLENIVLPSLNKKLKNYQVHFDLYQGCTTPFFVIKNRNNGPLDLEKIKAELNKALNEMNLPDIKPCMFSPAENMEDKKNESLRRSERLKNKG